nr:glycosyltransferase family A protein [Bacteroides timonensis]
MDISVVMACRNSNKSALLMAVNSILNQSCIDFELIIVDDGSDVPIENIMKEVEDKRIRLYCIEAAGLGAALNYGISKAKGKYIARLDDDDVMCSNRLKIQHYILENNPKVVCVGTQIYFKTKSKCIRYKPFPLTHDLILKRLVQLKQGMAHTALMFRKEAFDAIGGYRIKGGGQDIDLMLQLSMRGELMNIGEYLNYYNLSSQGLSVMYPVNKFRAYLFAFNSIKEESLFDKFRNEIDKTILLLEKKVNRKRYFIPNIRKIILIVFVDIFGRKFDSDKYSFSKS